MNKINISDFIILINNKIFESQEYFVPKADGIYHIKIFINHNIKNCNGFFRYCRNIINIDLSYKKCY